VAHWREEIYPGKRYRLQDAANDKRLLVVRGNNCMRTVYYLASDLLPILSPNRDAHQPPFPCSRCGTDASVQVKLRLPAPGDYGHLQVRRPGPVRHIQTWQTVMLGD
jgi:hypothetical protein